MFVSIYDSAQVGHAILMAARTIVLSERPPRVFLVFVSLFVYEDNGDGIDGFGTLISGAGSDQCQSDCAAAGQLRCYPIGSRRRRGRRFMGLTAGARLW